MSDTVLNMPLYCDFIATLHTLDFKQQNSISTARLERQQIRGQAY